MPFPAADINPILPIKARLGSVSTMELRLIRLFTELYFLALHSLLFVLGVSFLPHKLTLGSMALRSLSYFKIGDSRARKVRYLMEPSGKVDN